MPKWCQTGIFSLLCPPQCMFQLHLRVTALKAKWTVFLSANRAKGYHHPNPMMSYVFHDSMNDFYFLPLVFSFRLSQQSSSNQLMKGSGSFLKSWNNIKITKVTVPSAFFSSEGPFIKHLSEMFWLDWFDFFSSWSVRLGKVWS